MTKASVIIVCLMSSFLEKPPGVGVDTLRETPHISSVSLCRPPLLSAQAQNEMKCCFVKLCQARGCAEQNYLHLVKSKPISIFCVLFV